MGYAIFVCVCVCNSSVFFLNFRYCKITFHYSHCSCRFDLLRLTFKLKMHASDGNDNPAILEHK